MPDKQAPIIRWSGDQDRPTITNVIRRAWEYAYSSIFAPTEMEGLFEGRLPQSSTQLDDRKEQVGTLVAEIDSDLVGFAYLMLLENGDGELVAFYVLPEHQGCGVGLALWDASLAALRERGCMRMQVWVLAGVAAVRFYERRGCILIGAGEFRVGDHAERTLGYRIALGARDRTG